MNATPGHETITIATVAQNDLVVSLTTYARYGPCPPGVPLDLWRAYGPHYPGGPKRAAEAQAAQQHLRQRAEQRRATERAERARALWERAHRSVVT